MLHPRPLGPVGGGAAAGGGCGDRVRGEAMTLTFDVIGGLDAAEQLRVLRNECAEWMTKDTSQISAERQERFYQEKIATGAVEGFLVSANGEPVAYGLLVWDGEGRAWSSTGVKANRRGEGFGRIVTIENVRRAHAHGVPMWAEVRRDNAGQQKICHSIGYHLVDAIERGGLVIDVMRCDSLPGHA